VAAVSKRSPVFLDTTVLVSGLVDFGPASEAASRILDAVAAGSLPGPLTAWHCCLEFYSVATRLPEEFRLEPADARQLLEQEILSRLQICALPAGDRRGLFTVASEEGLVGGRVYDLHIGEVARRAGARIVVTDNRRHFSALLRHEVRVLSASDFVSDRGLA